MFNSRPNTLVRVKAGEHACLPPLKAPAVFGAGEISIAFGENGAWFSAGRSSANASFSSEAGAEFGDIVEAKGKLEVGGEEHVEIVVWAGEALARFTARRRRWL